MNQDEKPYIVTYWGKEHQLDEAEYQALVKAVENKDQYIFLKDKRILSTKFESLEPNIHYVSPESIAYTRKKKALWDEYQFLKKEGQLTTPEEYIAWKKESVKNIKAFQESLKEHAETENEKKRTT